MCRHDWRNVALPGEYPEPWVCSRCHRVRVWEYNFFDITLRKLRGIPTLDLRRVP